MNLRTIAFSGVAALAGLGLVGAGAHAVFTQNTSSAQTVTAGTMDVTVTAPNATCVGTNAAGGCNALTLPAFGPVGSTFATTPEIVTITNNSPFPVTELSVQLTDQNNNSTLQSGVWACFFVTKDMASINVPLALENDASNPWVVAANEPLSTVEAYGAIFTQAPLAAGGQDQYGVVFYAGAAPNGCGSTYSLVAPYDSSSGIYPPILARPRLHHFQRRTLPSTSLRVLETTNPDAGLLGLGQNAQGGTLIPTMTYTFNG